MNKSWLAGLFGALALAAPLRAAEAAPQTWVVLAGISTYADKQIPPRPRAEDDAKALYDLFTDADYLGVDEGHVRLLLGTADARRKSQPATRANLLKALRWLAAEARPDDLVIFAFLGRGATLGEEGDQLCYLAADSTARDRAANGVSAAAVRAELDQLKCRRFCALLDVPFTGIAAGGKPAPDVTLGEFPYREFRGSDGRELTSAAGRAVFLATDGLTPSLDLDRHGLFTQVLLDGLKGAADREGYEPDGVVTVGELAAYLNQRLPALALRHGTTLAQKRQRPVVLRGWESNYALTRNPAVTPRVRERLNQLARLARDGKVSPEAAREGRALLSRMPALASRQALRRDYQRLTDGALTPEEFRTRREAALAGTKLKRADAQDFARKVLAAAQMVRERYIKELKQGELVGWAVRGLYERAGEVLPADLAVRLSGAAELDEVGQTALLADARERLGKREDLDNHKDIDGALQQMLSHLDRNTTYTDPESVQRAEQETQARFAGVGFTVRKDPGTDLLLVVSPLLGSPAYRAGVKAGDLITHITRATDSNGKPLTPPEVIATLGVPLNELVKKTAGKPRTRVKFTVRREGVEKPLEFEVTRDYVEAETVLGARRKADDTWNYLADPAHKIGYVRLTQFAPTTPRDLDRVLKDLTGQGVKGLVLDLRFNQGGYLKATVETADLLIDDGLIVTTRPRAGRENQFQGKHEGSYLDFPVACLINGGSASGSEIVAACLQDHKRALIVGERSFGLGHVHNLFPFDGGRLKVLTHTFWRPSGKNLDKSLTTGKEDDVWGVTPDKGFVVKLPARERNELAQHLERQKVIPRRDRGAPDAGPPFKDRQLETALEYLRGQAKASAPPRK
jgi:C-terminal peptidase prc